MFLKNIFGRKKSVDLEALHVLYGGKSGNSQFIAKEAVRNLKKSGRKAEVVALNSYPFEQLSNQSVLLFVLSTDGEGEMPPNAGKFYSYLSQNNPDLSGLKYALCALGDSSYEFFCQAGKDLDQRLKDLGAIPLFERIDCDADFQPQAVKWLEQVLEKLNAKSDCEPASFEANTLPVYTTEIIRKIRLNPDSERAVYHLVLKNDDSKIAYEPGDSVKIIPVNPRGIVNEVIRLCHPETITDQESMEKFRYALAHDYELTSLTLPFLTAYSKLGQNKNLAEFMQDGDWLKHYQNHQDVADLLLDFPSRLSITELMELLPRMKARYYSIASSRSMNPGELHLTVRQVRFMRNDRLRHGACSTYLSQWMDEGREFQFQLAPTSHFRLPKDSSIPIIMIATGTGIAPFIGFMQEREFQNSKGNWLIFGEQYVERDFIYYQQIMDWKKRGFLPELDVAFSRDEPKEYVQNLLFKRKELLDYWLHDRAIIYLCGSLRMGRAVRDTLEKIMMDRLRCSLDEAKLYVQKLEDNGRLLTDLY